MPAIAGEYLCILAFDFGILDASLPVVEVVPFMTTSSSSSPASSAAFLLTSSKLDRRLNEFMPPAFTHSWSFAWTISCVALNASCI